MSALGIIVIVIGTVALVTGGLYFYFLDKENRTGQDACIAVVGSLLILAVSLAVFL